MCITSSCLFKKKKTTYKCFYIHGQLLKGFEESLSWRLSPERGTGLWSGRDTYFSLSTL